MLRIKGFYGPVGWSGSTPRPSSAEARVVVWLAPSLLSSAMLLRSVGARTVGGEAAVVEDHAGVGGQMKRGGKQGDKDGDKTEYGPRAHWEAVCHFKAATKNWTDLKKNLNGKKYPQRALSILQQTCAFFSVTFHSAQSIPSFDRTEIFQLKWY